jgi:hypothetical protein
MKAKKLQRHFSARASGLLLLLFVSRLGLIAARADAVSELASFSIFDKVDLAQLAKSDVKTAHGPPMSNPRFLAVQSCYVAPGAPAQQIEALRRWDATRHRELKVFLHSDLPSNPTPANFEKLKDAPGNSSVRSFVTATQKLVPVSRLARRRQRNFLREPEAAVARCLQQLWGFGQMCLPRGPKASCQAECPHKLRTITAAHLFGRATK